MANKRHARKTYRHARRLAETGDHRGALPGYVHAAAALRDHLDSHADDEALTELTDLLQHAARTYTALADHANAAACLDERLQYLRHLEAPPHTVAATELDLAEAHLRAGHLLTAATRADDAIRSFNQHTANDPEHARFTDLTTALARNARILRHSADQAVRMLLARPAIRDDPARLTLLRDTLTIAVELHTLAGRSAHARTARQLHTKWFPVIDLQPFGDTPAPLTLRTALAVAEQSGLFNDADLTRQLCSDPGAYGAPASISSRCDPVFASVALHELTGAVEALAGVRPRVAWRLATELHYLLWAADQRGETNLRLNFRDHGPVWVAMLLAVAPAAERSTALADDLADTLAALVERLRSRHAASRRDPVVLAATRYVEQRRGATRA
jgi:hypothetical protein